MDRARYAELVRTFFELDPAAIAPIFHDLLTSAVADTPPPTVLDRSGGLSDAFRAIAPAFHATDGWASPLHLENVRGPASVASLVGAVACLLKNPNLFTRAGGQGASDLEASAIAALAGIVFPGAADPGGVFTPGGTHSNLYGAKLGIEKVLPGAMRDGIGGLPVVGVASEASHFSNRTAAGWLGLGSRNLHLVPTDRTLAMRSNALAETLDRLYRGGQTVAYVVGTVGTTDGFGCDDVAAVRRVIDGTAAAHRAPVPHLHVDAAVGWPLGLFHGYDLEANPLGLTPDLLPIIRRAQQVIRGLKHADSATVDFHKMGYGHYPSSAFLVSRRDDLRFLVRSPDDMTDLADPYSEGETGTNTLDTSRPGLGPFIVTASLNAIGRQGWQLLVARALELAHFLKQRLAALPRCAVMNPDAPGPNVVFWVLGRQRDAAATFRRLDSGEMTPAEVAECFVEVRGLFETRARRLDPARDTRLGFTSDYGYRPGGHRVPAWKAVFFNPKTDEAIIDRLIDSIAALP